MLLLQVMMKQAKSTHKFFSTEISFNFQCYHNNRGYCSFRDRCRYQHFQETCSKTVCRDKECKKRHPVNCRYKDDCKFYKMNMCAFKHAIQKSKVAVDSTDFENEYKMVNEEINKLKDEITDLKREISVKEKELVTSKAEIEHLKKELTQKQQYPESDKELLVKTDNKLIENDKEDLDLGNELALKQTSDGKRPDILTTVSKFKCEKCCLRFSSAEKVKKHNSEMHKVKLAF